MPDELGLGRESKAAKAKRLKAFRKFCRKHSMRQPSKMKWKTSDLWKLQGADMEELD